MAKNKQTYTLEIDAELGNLQGKLNSVKTLLANVLNSANAPKGLDKSLEKVGELIEKIRIKASQPMDSKTGFNSISKDIGNVQIALVSLLETVRTVQSLSDAEKMNFLPKDAQAQISKIISSLTNYTSALDAATTETAELAAAREKLALAEQKVSTAKARVDTKQSGLDEAKAEKQAAEQAIAAIEERKKGLKELKEEQKKIEEFYEGTDEQGNKRSRAKKYEGASMRPQDIAKKIAKLEAANAGDDKSLEELREKLKAAKADVNSYTKQLATANRVYKEASQEQQELSKTVEDLNKDFETSRPDILQKAYSQLKETAKELGISLEGIGEAYSERDSEELIKRLSDLKKEGFDNLTKSAGQAEENLEDFGEGCRKIKDDVQEGAEALEELNEAVAKKEAFADKIKQFVGLAGASQVLHSALRNAMETIKELDATMTEMATVTDLSVGDYWDQLPEYSQRASELGVSIDSAYKAATLYYQQGLKANEVSAISAETLKMAKIAGLDAADATDKMTAALRGFNMELNETSAQRVSDVYSELAAITAADTKEIANAMTKTASIASSAGMEFETTAAFLSQIIETTRESAETAGTAMKTVVARFQELKKDPSEIGEVEGEIVDANKIETALRSVGVALRDANGQFRDLDDVFLELSSKWDSLDKNTQRYIATIAAGSRQQSRFIAMMSDYSRTQELVTSANNSAGASQRQFEKTLEGVEAKLAKLKNAWDEFTMGIMNSDFVKFAIDALTKILEVINKATSAFDGFFGSIVKIAGVLAIFKLGQALFNKMKEPLLEFAQEVVTQMGITGERSGKAFVENFKKAADEAMKTGSKTSTSEKPDSEGAVVPSQEQEDGKKTAKQWLGEKTGASKIRAGAKQLREVRNARKANAEEIAKKQQKIDDNKFSLAVGIGAEEAEAAKEEIKGLEEEIDKLKQKETEMADQSAKAWGSIGEGISSVGQALTGIGVSISLIGGLLSSLGADGAGEVISAIGNGIMIAGSALSAVIPIITAIQALLSTPPLGIIMIILAAVVALITAVVVISKKLSLQNRMKEAAEATEAAKKAAEEAKEVYDSMLSDQSKYDELQKTLEELTYGTREWKKALVEVNNQVLELLQTYPLLAKYLSRGEDGQLVVTDEGWDALIKQQERSVANSQALISAKQQEEQDLKKEKALSEFNKKTAAYTETWNDTNSNRQKDSGEVSRTFDYALTEQLKEELKDLYLVQGSSLKENQHLVEQLSGKYGITTDELWAAADALEDSKTNLEAISLESENLARATLTALAPEAVTKDEQGQQIIDAFATSQTLDHYDSLITNRANELYSKNGISESKNNEEFQKLASEYNVSDKMTGNDKADLETLYKAMAGVEKVPDKLAGNTDELKKAIAAMDVASTTNQKMADYVLKLNTLGSQQQNNVAGIFSQEGLGMTAEFADALIASFEDGVEGNTVLSEQAAAMGMTIEDWASTLNMTVEDFYDTAEKNARSAQTARIKSFEKLNKTLEKSDEERVKRFGESAQLSAAQEEALSQKLINVANLSGDEAANSIVESLGVALDSVGENADELAAYLGSMNWQDVGDWEGLQEVLKEMGITWTEEVATFANSAMTASRALKIVDFEKLNSELKSVYDTLKNIKSGEQGRSFDEETYKLLVASNKNLAKDFVQIGDEFIYVGTSMGMLTEALENNTIAILDEAKQQYAAKIEMANAVGRTKASYGGKELSIDGDYSKWSELELREYLEEYRKTAWNMTSGEGGTKDENALSYLDTEGIGLSFVTDFSDYSQEQLVQLMNLIKDNYDNLPNLMEADRKALEDSLVTRYTLKNSGKENASGAQELREAGQEEGAQLYSRALMTQASQSGTVSEAILSKYAEFLEKYAENPEDEKVVKELKDLEASMSNGIDKVIENKEGNAALIEIQNRIADAIAESRQKEIDKLSEVNSSIQAGNGALIQKIQEQINEDRQERVNQKAESNIADLQARRSYLALDSNANALEIAELDKQIANAEENYQDTLVDQALQDLSDANEKAAEQRERQISLLQQQLDEEKNSGAIAKDAKTIAESSLDQVTKGASFLDTPGGKIIKEGENWGALSPEEFAEKEEAIQKTAVTAANAKIVTELGKVDNDVEDLGGNGEADSISKIAEILQNNESDRTVRKEAVEKAVKAIRDNKEDIGGTQYQEALASYLSAGGTANQLKEEVASYLGGEELLEEFKTVGKLTDGKAWNAWNWNDVANGAAEQGYITLDGGSKYLIKVEGVDAAASKMVSHKGLNNGTAFSYAGKGYVAYNKQAYKITKTKKSGEWKDFSAFKTGGLADFTGPAWLDGTKSRPEYVLNAAQTERFFSLIDVLERFDNKTAETKTSGGDNHFDIKINVDKLESDYDVEQLANKIRKMIYEDASYRNVNAINLIR